MHLYELVDEEPIVASIVAATDQLKNDLENKKVSFDWDVDTLLQYFRKYDVDLDVTDLHSMIQQPPLNKVIKNIQGDKVVFKGQEEKSPPQKPKPDDQTVSKMAKHAMNKRP